MSIAGSPEVTDLPLAAVKSHMRPHRRAALQVTVGRQEASHSGRPVGRVFWRPRVFVNTTPPTTIAPPTRVVQSGRSPSHTQLINSAIGVEE